MLTCSEDLLRSVVPKRNGAERHSGFEISTRHLLYKQRGRVWLARGAWQSYLPARHLAMYLPSIHPADLLLWHTVVLSDVTLFHRTKWLLSIFLLQDLLNCSSCGQIWECCGLDLGRERLEGRMWPCCLSRPHEPHAGPPAPRSTTSHT